MGCRPTAPRSADRAHRLYTLRPRLRCGGGYDPVQLEMFPVTTDAALAVR
jgi:hypothetical protein